MQIINALEMQQFMCFSIKQDDSTNECLKMGKQDKVPLRQVHLQPEHPYPLSNFISSLKIQRFHEITSTCGSAKKEIQS